jgi:signal transduction histidine kinase
LLVDQADEFVASAASDGRLLYGNPAICDALGYSLREFSSLQIQDVLKEDWKQLQTRSGEIVPVQFDVTHATLDGEEFVLFRGRPAYFGRLLEMQDEERRRIARQLHDTTGQNLGALRIGLSMILATAATNPSVRKAIEESIALADCCVREIRDLSYLLHPPLLDELGLGSALRAFSDVYAEKTGIALELDLPQHLPRFPQAIEIALFRIVQEGLENIHRHSGSETAILRLKHESGNVQLDITDHGNGLPPGTIGVGIAAMKERARRLGGLLTIVPAETGTTVHVVVPTSSAA